MPGVGLWGRGWPSGWSLKSKVVPSVGSRWRGGRVEVFEKVEPSVWSLKNKVVPSVWSLKSKGMLSVWSGGRGMADCMVGKKKVVPSVWSLKSKVVPSVGSRWGLWPGGGF